VIGEDHQHRVDFAGVDLLREGLSIHVTPR
jgi:hypothetical protein